MIGFGNGYWLPRVGEEGRMKRRYILIGSLFLAVVLILVLLMMRLNQRQDEDLFKQVPEDTLASAEIEAESSDEAENTSIGTEQEATPQEENIRKEDVSIIASEESEEPKKEDQDIIDNNDNIASEQQEAAMETQGHNITESFYSEEITQKIKDRINGKSYGEDCDIPYEELRYVSVLYWDFDHQSRVGELIVNKAITEDIIEIFAELYEAQYPIEQMVLVDEYDADDNKSMAANNTSAFNYRVVEGTNRISKHSYGLAIDINPLYNPYVHEVDGERVVTPVEGAMYEDRSLDSPYYIHSEDLCYQAFIRRGFTWGGDWKNQKDYQHFQKVLTKD
jgi:hypothetical protein